MTHWIENIATELAKRDVEEHIIASGTSISGVWMKDDNDIWIKREWLCGQISST